MASIEQWEEAVKRSYRFSVTTEEYNDKATPEAVNRIARYLQGTYEGEETLELLDDTSSDEPNTTVQLLFDFLAFTS